MYTIRSGALFHSGGRNKRETPGTKQTTHIQSLTFESTATWTLQQQEPCTLIRARSQRPAWPRPQTRCQALHSHWYKGGTTRSYSLTTAQQHSKIQENTRLTTLMTAANEALRQVCLTASSSRVCIFGSYGNGCQRELEELPETRHQNPFRVLQIISLKILDPISHDDGLIPAITLLLIALKMLKWLNLFLQITGLTKHTAPSLRLLKRSDMFPFTGNIIFLPTKNLEQ